MAITFVACLAVGVEVGLIIGIATSLLMLLLFSSSPMVSSTKLQLSENNEVMVMKPDRSVHFPGIDKVRNVISKKALKNPKMTIVVDCQNMISIDFTAAKVRLYIC
jgi:sodium-independent sulfate anion transporter 11